MNDIATADIPMKADPQLTELHRLLAQLAREELSLKHTLENLDDEDATHFDAPSDDPAALQRQKTRLTADAALHQVHNRQKGARAALRKREGEVIEAAVQEVRKDIEQDLDAIDAAVLRASEALNVAIEEIYQVHSRGFALVAKYRGVRGRSALTKDGHLPGGELTALASIDNVKFAVDSHFRTHIPYWRGDIEATGEFAVRMGGMVRSTRMAISALLGQEAIRDALAAEIGVGKPSALEG